MKNTLLLTKILFLNSFGLNSKNKKQSKSMSRVGTIALFAFLILFVAVPMVGMGIGVGLVFKELGLVKEGISSFLPMMSVMVLFFSIFGIISTFFLSSDIETLLSLPFKPREILVAKFINSLSSVYLIEIMMFFPILIGLGIGAGLNVLFYINSILVTIFLPIIPLSIFGMLLTSLMRYTALNRIKDKIQYVVMLVAIVFAIGLEFFTMSMGETDAELGNAIANSGGALNYVMFFTIPASIALASENILLSIGSMIFYIAISIGSVYLFSIVGEKFYIKGILGKPQLKLKKDKKEEVILKEEKSNSIFKELVKNEIKTIKRSPTFNMNLLLPVFILPIILSISFIFGLNSEVDMGMGELLPLVKEILNFKDPSTLVFTIAVFSFFTSMSMISSTSISRDGKNAYINKVIPVKPITIINAKVFWGIVFGIIPCFLLSIGAMVLGLMDIVDVLLINIPLFLYIMFTNYIGIIIDLKRPKLDWENETVAVKQNFNSMIYMLIDMAFTIVICAFGVLFIFIKIPAFVASLILSLIFLLLCVIIYRLIDKKGLEAFINIG